VCVCGVWCHALPVVCGDARVVRAAAAVHRAATCGRCPRRQARKRAAVARGDAVAVASERVQRHVRAVSCRRYCCAVTQQCGVPQGLVLS
jgi:hypothetical protein